MIIKNENINLKIGNRQFNFNNLILNYYIYLIANNVYSGEIIPKADVCCIKFDSALNFNKSTILTKSMFDTQINLDYSKTNESNNGVIIEYIYQPVDVDYSGYVDKRIMTIGFFNSDIDTCLACVDTSSYSITLKTNENITVIRNDNFYNNTNFISDDFSFPIHLSPFGKLTTNGTYRSYISAVGLGTNKNIPSYRIDVSRGNIETEPCYVLQGSKIAFFNCFLTEQVNNILYPNFKTPNNITFPTDTGKSFSYIFFIFKVQYKSFENGSQWTETNKEYIISSKLNVNSIDIYDGNKFNYHIKYERR